MNNDKQSIVDFTRIVSDRYDQLTKSEKRIADYISNNQEESAFLTAAEIADRLSLSEPTLVRFARSLGFSSFPDMRTLLQEAFRRRIAHSERLRGRLENLRQGGNVFESLVVSEIDYLSQALEIVDNQALQKTVELMRTSEHIFIFGQGSSISLANLLEIRLRRYGRHVIPLTTIGREILEPLMLMKNNDLLFMICFVLVHPAQKLALEYANKVNSPIVILTDSISSEISDKANVVLAARRGQMGEDRSLVVHMTIINTLLLMFANEEQDFTMTNLDNLDLLRERLKSIDRARN